MLSQGQDAYLVKWKLKNEIANQSIIAIDDLVKIKSGLGIVFCGNNKSLNPLALMHK